MTAASDDDESPLAKRLRASQDKKPPAEASKPAPSRAPQKAADTEPKRDEVAKATPIPQENIEENTPENTEAAEESPSEKLAKFLEQRRKERAQTAPKKAATTSASASATTAAAVSTPKEPDDGTADDDDLPPLRIQPSARLDALLKPKPSAEPAPTPPPLPSPPPEKKPAATAQPRFAPPEPPAPPQQPLEPPRGGGDGNRRYGAASPAVPRPPSPFAWLFGLLFRLLLALYKPFNKYFGKPFTKLLHAVLGVAAWTGVMAFGGWGVCYMFLPPYIICNKVQCYTYITKFNIFSARHWEILEKAYNYNFTIPTSYTAVGVSLALFWLVGSTWASVHGYDFFRLRRVAITLENISRSLLGLFRRR